MGWGKFIGTAGLFGAYEFLMCFANKNNFLCA